MTNAEMMESLAEAIADANDAAAEFEAAGMTTQALAAKAMADEAARQLELIR